LVVKKRKKKKPLEASEEEMQLFKELCAAINQFGIETRIEQGDFRGGFCLVEGDKEMLILNKKHSLDKRIALMINELKKKDFFQNTLPPELMEKIERWV
jgi:hypothetical protein